MNTAIEKRQQQSAVPTAQDRRNVMPRVDIVETDKAFVLIADMPGVSKEEVHIDLNGDELVIEGAPTHATLQHWHASHTEFEPVNYHRAFRLSADVEREHIEASVKDGVLRLTLPKAAEVKPKKIAVQSA